MNDSPYIPPAVLQCVDQIEEDLGQRPRLVSPAPRHWEIRLEGQHVLATNKVRLRGMDGKLVFRAGVLEVDGKPRPTARSRAELISIWRRYELGEIAEIPDLPPYEGPPEEMPAAIRKIYDKLCAEDHPAHYRLVVSLHGGLWYIGAVVEHGEGAGCILMAFRRASGLPEAWVPDAAASILIRDGVRVPFLSIDELLRKLMEMLHAQRAQPASASAGPIRQGSPATPAMSNSVAARRASVIRV